MWNLAKYSSNVAFVDESKNYTYRQILILTNKVKKKLSKKKNLTFILCQNSIGSILAYISSILNKDVPFVIDSDITNSQLSILLKKYKPEFIWIPAKNKFSKELKKYKKILNLLKYELYKYIENTNYIINNELCTLASTSGSTGNPKYVRQTYKNIVSNSKSIIKYLKISRNSVTITTLPMSYTFGQSIINTHLFAGGKIILNKHSILQKNFWDLFKQYKISYLYGVPYSFELLDKLNFFNKKNNTLKCIAQAGGKLSIELQKKILKFSINNNKKFYIMYGQAEATTRISYLELKKNPNKIGSIGKPILGGKLYLLSNNRKKINKIQKTGELIYEGQNVCSGYSKNYEDLKKGDEWKGLIATGDIAKKDNDGFFYIVGRKKRIAKIFGKSINLDDIENKLSLKFKNLNITVISNDVYIYIFYNYIEKNLDKKMNAFLKKNFLLNTSIYRFNYLKKIPKLKSGKKNYFKFLTKIKNLN